MLKFIRNTDTDFYEVEYDAGSPIGFIPLGVLIRDIDGLYSLQCVSSFLYSQELEEIVKKLVCTLQK